MVKNPLHLMQHVKSIAVRFNFLCGLLQTISSPLFNNGSVLNKKLPLLRRVSIIFFRSKVPKKYLSVTLIHARTIVI